MKPIMIAAWLLGAALAAPSAALAADSQERSVGRVVDDAVVTTKVKAALAEEPSVKAMDINVNTYRGVVQLSGFVESETVAERAVAVAREVEGVQSVRNDLRVSPPGK